MGGVHGASSAPGPRAKAAIQGGPGALRPAQRGPAASVARLHQGSARRLASGLTRACAAVQNIIEVLEKNILDQDLAAELHTEKNDHATMKASITRLETNHYDHVAVGDFAARSQGRTADREKKRAIYEVRGPGCLALRPVVLREPHLSRRTESGARDACEIRRTTWRKL